MTLQLMESLLCGHVLSLEESLSCLPQGLVKNRKDHQGGWALVEKAVEEWPGTRKAPEQELLSAGDCEVGTVTASLLSFCHSHLPTGSAPGLCPSGPSCFAWSRGTEGWRVARESLSCWGQPPPGSYSLIPSRLSLSWPFRCERTRLNFQKSLNVGLCFEILPML